MEQTIEKSKKAADNTARALAFRAWRDGKATTNAALAARWGFNHYVVAGWARGNKPREIYRRIIERKDPDCPLAKS